jgi:hypothetical protein
MFAFDPFAALGRRVAEDNNVPFGLTLIGSSSFLCDRSQDSRKLTICAAPESIPPPI